MERRWGCWGNGSEKRGCYPERARLRASEGSAFSSRESAAACHPERAHAVREATDLLFLASKHHALVIPSRRAQCAKRGTCFFIPRKGRDLSSRASARVRERAKQVPRSRAKRARSG